MAKSLINQLKSVMKVSITRKILSLMQQGLGFVNISFNERHFDSDENQFAYMIGEGGKDYVIVSRQQFRRGSVILSQKPEINSIL